MGSITISQQQYRTETTQKMELKATTELLRHLLGNLLRLLSGEYPLG